MKSTEGAAVRRFSPHYRALTATVSVLITVAACSSGGGSASAPVSAAPHVVFYAEGEGTAAAMTLRSESGGTIQKDVALPLTDTSKGTAGLSSDLFKRGDTFYISLQNKDVAGSVTCRIEVDSKVVDEATSSGAYKVVSCQGKVP
jgi:hypothetical protein